jgi:type IV pilus assembly protein PilM
MGHTGKNVVGLDIEPGYVAAVQGGARGVSVERAATMPLAPGVVRDGEVVDVDTLAGALKEMFAANKLGKRVRIGVANPRIVMRTLDLPPLTEAKDIASAARFQAQEHIPMPLEQAVLEHHALGIVETADGPRTRVVLVAARRDMIDRVLEAVRRAGLRPHGIDLSAFAMIRALHSAERVEPTLYMNVGGVSNLAVAAGTTCLFTRVTTNGTESMAVELAERRGLTLEHAHGWLRYIGLVTPVDDLTGDPEISMEGRAVLSDGVRRIADDVRNSIDYHVMQEGAGEIQHAVLTGPAIAIPGFAESLSEQIGLQVEIGEVTEAKPGAFGGVDAGSLAVATGLTIDEAAA